MANRSDRLLVIRAAPQMPAHGPGTEGNPRDGFVDAGNPEGLDVH
jgi:hypothetical protein